MSRPYRVPEDHQSQAALIAFISADDAVDRAGAIANLAWLLASAQRSVLVLDLAGAVHRVDRYLAQFLVDRGSPATVGDAREIMAAFEEWSWEPTLMTRFALAAEPFGTVDVLQVGAGEPPPRPDPRTGFDGDADRLRTSLVQTPYDYVIINAPLLREQVEAGVQERYDLVARVCDVAVLCFSHRQSTAAKAAAIGRSLRQLAPGGIQLVPVAFAPAADGMLFPPRPAEPVTLFTELLSANPQPGGEALAVPEIAVEGPVLTLMTEPPAGPRPITDAYALLAGAVTFGDVRAIGAIPDAYFAKYRRSVGLSNTDEPDRFLVIHTPADRRWADWVVAELRSAGARVNTLSQGGAPTQPFELVVIMSTAFEDSAQYKYVRSLGGTIVRRTQIIVEGAEQLPEMSVLRLVGVEPETAAGRLHNHFGLVRALDEVHFGPSTAARHPAVEPGVIRLPRRKSVFVGRDDVIEDLRDRFLYGGESRVTLTGTVGVGKANLALEYAHRFRTDYDVVWWIPGHDRESVLAHIMMLGRKLRADPKLGEVPGPLQLLRSDLVTDRWLLVFAHADGLALYEDLLPLPGNGHVIITSSSCDGLNVPPLAPAESAAVLRNLLPQVEDPDQTARLAAAVGHVPLALELAAAWLSDVERTRAGIPDTARQENREMVEEFIEQFRATANGVDEVTRVIKVMTTHLERTPDGRLTVLLAKFCAFLSPEGVSLGLLRSGAVIGQLVDAAGPDAARLAADPAEIDQLLGHGHRLRLFAVDWGAPSSVTQAAVVRQTLQSLVPEGFRAKMRDHVLLGVARYAPSEMEMGDPVATHRYAELNRHIMSTGSGTSNQPEVRRWLVNQTGYLFRTNDQEIWEAALDPARQLLDQWRTAHTDRDQYVCALQAQVANICRGLGRYEEAFKLDSQALDIQRILHSPTHFRALRTASGLGADLRALGRFADAMDEDIATLQGLREAFGDDHPATRSAQNNLAVSYFHAGEVSRALEMGREDVRHRERLFGGDHAGMWQTLANLGVYERASGLTAESVRTLKRARDLANRVRSTTPVPFVLVKWLLSISMRLDPAEDNVKAKGLNAEALRDLRHHLGDAHPQTLACKLSYATVHRAIREPRAAVGQAEEALDGFLGLPGMTANHPYPAICRVELGLALSLVGQVDQAVKEVRRGWDALTESLGPAHPVTLSAQIDHSAVLAAAGRAEEAREAADTAAQACLDYLTRNHHYQPIAQANQRAARDPDDTWQTIDLNISMP